MAHHLNTKVVHSAFFGAESLGRQAKTNRQTEIETSALLPTGKQNKNYNYEKNLFIGKPNCLLNKHDLLQFQ